MKIAFVLCLLAISVKSAPQIPNFQFPQFNFPNFANLNFPNFNIPTNMFPNMVPQGMPPVMQPGMPQSAPNFNPSNNQNNFEPSKNPDNYRPSETAEELDACKRECEPKRLAICGYDTDPKFGQTFESECEMDKFACAKRNGMKFKNMLIGNCPN